jgi:hypothetical protein
VNKDNAVHAFHLQFYIATERDVFHRG